MELDDCHEACMNDTLCVAYWSNNNAFMKLCNLYSESNTGQLLFSPGTSSDSNLGLKYCNIASANLDDYTKYTYESDNPFYTGTGLTCNITVPKYCRKLPTTKMVALPTSKDGKCLDNPKDSELAKFCPKKKTVILRLRCMLDLIFNVSFLNRLNMAWMSFASIVKLEKEGVLLECLLLNHGLAR